MVCYSPLAHLGESAHGLKPLGVCEVVQGDHGLQTMCVHTVDDLAKPVVWVKMRAKLGVALGDG